MRVKYLAEMGGVDILMMVIRSSGSPFFPAAVLALSHLARSLPLSTSDSAWLEDSYFISERGGGPTVVDAAEHRCNPHFLRFFYSCDLFYVFNVFF